MDTAKWPQEFIVKPMNETCLRQSNPAAAATAAATAAAPVEKKAKPEKDQALNCPRCNSLNTKFCYYNNYSLTQPRYFCKDCKRYWTQGGSLRNIPIGGGVRKNKRSSSSSNSNSSSSSKKTHLVDNNNNKTPPPLQQPNLQTAENNHVAAAAKVQELVYSHGFGNAHEAKDLNSAFSQGFGIGHHHQNIPEFLQVLPSSMKNHTLVSTSSALELLGISNSSTTSSNSSRPAFVTYPNVHDSSVYTAASPGFGMSYPQFQEFMRPPLGFSLDGGDPLRQEQGSSGTDIGRPLLPFESLKLHVSSSSTNSGGVNGNDHEREKEEGEADNSVGFWNGMLSTGASTASASGPWQ